LSVSHNSQNIAQIVLQLGYCTYWQFWSWIVEHFQRSQGGYKWKNASVKLLMILNWSRMQFVRYKSEGLMSGERVVVVSRKMFTDVYWYKHFPWNYSWKFSKNFRYVRYVATALFLKRNCHILK